jgi:hypothetical protein
VVDAMRWNGGVALSVVALKEHQLGLLARAL